MLEKCEGIVIRTTDYGETNKITTLYTREWGKVGVMARGAKKTNSRLSAVTQPLHMLTTWCSVQVVSGLCSKGK